tara:strand:- start:121 stop:330 length:210 start_codon:yes stop_codon:yes gene_type:complete
MSTQMLRALGPLELAHLAGDWGNAKVDTGKYSKTVLSACECDQATYDEWNGPKQIWDNRYFIGGGKEVS